MILSFLVIGCWENNTRENKPVDNVKNDVNTSREADKKQDTSKLEEVQKDEADQIEELIKNYEENLIQAINNNNFSLVEPYLVKDSPLYKSQKKLVNDLYLKGIKEKLISYEIAGFSYEPNNVFKIQVVETIAIKYPQKDETRNEYQWIYTANKAGNAIKLSQIEKWKDYDDWIKTMESSVKADGYYYSELIYNGYDTALIQKLNNDSSVLDEILENKKVKEKHDTLIKDLKSKGDAFEIIKSEVLEDTWTENSNSSTNKAKKRLELSYMDKDSNKKKLDLTFTLTVTEYRTGFRNFYGYAKVIDIEDIKIN